MALGFRLVTDARDPSAGTPMRQPSDGMPPRQPGGVSSAPPFSPDLPDRHPNARASGTFDAFGGGDLPARGPARPARPAGPPPAGPAPAGPVRGAGQRRATAELPVR